MKRLVFAVFLVLLGSSSVQAAGCNPPAGLSIQQWYSICGGALQQFYAMGMGQGAPYDVFVQNMYQVYAQPVMQQGPAPGGGNMMCSPGQVACFNGWLRTCQTISTGGTWWVTGAQRCSG